jgi:hypothetical protein
MSMAEAGVETKSCAEDLYIGVIDIVTKKEISSPLRVVTAITRRD